MSRTGKVKWFNESKGYGFITLDPDGNESADKDCFVHYSAIEGDGYRTLTEGEAVTFELVEGQKGLAAERVRRQTG